MEELEVVTSPDTADQAKHLTTRLENLFEEFKVHHYSVIDLLDEDDECTRARNLYTQDEDVDQLTVRLDKLFFSSRLLPINWSISKRVFLQSSATSLRHLLMMMMMSVSFTSWRNSCKNSRRNSLTFAAACSH